MLKLRSALGRGVGSATASAAAARGAGRTLAESLARRTRLPRRARARDAAAPRPWKRRTLVGVAAPLLFMAGPAGAASLTGISIATTVGFALALWAMLVDSALPSMETDVIAATLGGVMVAGLGWRHAARGRRSRLLALGGASETIAERVPRAPVAAPDLAPRTSECPAGVDRAEVLAAARARFIGLQAAWDRRDVAALRELTTPPMLEELLGLLDARGEAPNRTEVLKLDVELLGIEEVGTAYLAGVEFSGLIRECAHEGAVPFRELWLLAALKDDAGVWRLARQQALL
ncbi:Tim44 domain-containing protein [Piscinibacter koreensis]|uniref:Tim44 domain-containing protein n=1 Tax=Piscinibacter koreensis TaxID=2742824 RepID=A0A7Y6NM78_9BURK|nr:Tim44-like domain-containing protein [Schlegelella koreensis]NUZ05768.1 Tim44 domain-containing protein [Schlegelella koreensis]